MRVLAHTDCFYEKKKRCSSSSSSSTAYPSNSHFRRPSPPSLFLLPLMTQPKVQYSGGGREGGGDMRGRRTEKAEGGRRKRKHCLLAAHWSTLATDGRTDGLWRPMCSTPNGERGRRSCFANTCARAPPPADGSRHFGQRRRPRRPQSNPHLFRWNGDNGREAAISRTFRRRNRSRDV